jgi:hypothetical protein
MRSRKAKIAAIRDRARHRVAPQRSQVPEGAAAEVVTVPPDEAAALGAARQASLLVWDEFEGFRAAYRDDATKLHAFAPSHTQVACLPAGLALATANGHSVPLLAPNAPLPIHGHFVSVPAASLGGSAGAAWEVALVEVDASGPATSDAAAAKLATFTFAPLAAAPAALAATLDVTAAGGVSLTLRVLCGAETLKSKAAVGTEIAVKIPAP